MVSGPEGVILISVLWLPEQLLPDSCCVTATGRYDRQSRGRIGKLGIQSPVKVTNSEDEREKRKENTRSDLAW